MTHSHSHKHTRLAVSTLNRRTSDCVSSSLRLRSSRTPDGDRRPPNHSMTSRLGMNGEVGSEASLTTRLAVACTYCSKSIGHRTGDSVPKSKPPTPAVASSGGGGKKSREGEEASCSCRKPRSRCALCLSRLNTSSSLALFAQRRRPTRFPFDSFTVFCATCRHSGHALHYLEWFDLHSNCPVAGCTCTCSSLDSLLRLEPS